jgi:hypothetical protein
MMDSVNGALDRFERRYGQALPAALREAWLSGRVPVGEVLFETGDKKVAGWITEFWPLEANNGGPDESYTTEYEELSLGGLLPRHLLPIAVVSNHDRIVISLGGADSGHVYYWAWSEEPDPESNSTEYLRHIATDFGHFVAGLRTGFDALKVAFPHFDGDFTPPWGLPTRDDFARIEARHGLRYPEAFITFQTCDATRLPCFPEGFRWANAGLEPYASLEDLITSTQPLGLSDFMPFADDNGDLIGFVRGKAVARYDHAGGALHEEAPDFVQWMWQQYTHHAQRYVHGE